MEHYQNNDLSNVGLVTKYSATGLSINSGTMTRFSETNFTLPAGAYLLIARISFNSNKNGIRGISFLDSSSATVSNLQVTQNAVDGSHTRMINISPQEYVSYNRNVYTYLYQDSGSTLSIPSITVYVLKLK